MFEQNENCSAAYYNVQYYILCCATLLYDISLVIIIMLYLIGIYIYTLYILYQQDKIYIIL